jgi:hypothetical protein
MAIDLDDLSFLASGSSAATSQPAVPTDDGQILDGDQINPRIWARVFALTDVAGLTALCIPAFNLGHMVARYGALASPGRAAAPALLAALYVAISFASGAHASAKIFDLRKSVRRLALSVGAAIAAIFVAHSVPRHGEAHVAIKLCLVAALALAALSTAKFCIAWAVDRRIAAGSAHFFRALNVGIGCDPTPPSQVARLSQNYAYAARNIRLESARDLAALSDMIADKKIDCVYVSSVWSQSPAVTRYLGALQNSVCRGSALPTRCSLDIRQTGELTVRASMTSIGVAQDRLGLGFKRAHDIGLALLALSIASV